MDSVVSEPADKCAPRESLKAPPAKKRKATMKVRDYVCIHSGLLGECHLPCRIVRDFLVVAIKCTAPRVFFFSGSELVVLLSKCCTIPLDRWHQAPRVSLRSIACDSAVTEHCDRSLPESSEHTVTLSSSEDEDMGYGMWVRNVLYTLTHDNQDVVVSPTGWLTDKVVTTAQMLILQHFPTMSGLQPPPLQEVFAFKVHSGEYVQIIHVRNNHWCVVSTVGCESEVVNVYDSLYTSVSDETIHLIASMVHSSSPPLVVRVNERVPQLSHLRADTFTVPVA